MIEISDALQMLNDALQDALKKAGFSLYYPQDAARNALPVVTERDTQYVSYKGDGCTLRVEFAGNAVGLYYADSEPDTAQKGDFTLLTQSLFMPQEAEVRDVQYITEDFSDTLSAKFTGGRKPQTKKKPNAVSKTDVRNGAFYDLPSCGNRFTAIYPELRSAFMDNINTYDEFLADEFFTQYGTPLVLDIIRGNDPVKMKKLFNLLNEMYDNGVNDVQSLIVVTILGSMQNDETMIANCVDYMSDELCVNVIRVNKYLASGAGKTARMRLDNPPRYKPKKAKRQGLLAGLMGGGQGPGLQG